MRHDDEEQKKKKEEKKKKKRRKKKKKSAVPVRSVDVPMTFRRCASRGNEWSDRFFSNSMASCDRDNDGRK